MKVGILGLGLIGGSLARAYALEGHTVYAIQRNESMLSFAMLSGAVHGRLCVVQMQDYLELGKEARMNFPGTLSSANWTWRAEKGFDSDALAARIYAATKLYGRVGK